MTRRIVVDAGALEQLVEAAATVAHDHPALAGALAALLGSSSTPRDAVSVAEAADRLGVSVRTIRRRIADGSLPHRRLGRRVLVPLAATSGQERSGEDTTVAAAGDRAHHAAG